MKLRTIFLSAVCVFSSISFLNAQISTGISIGVMQSHLKSDLFEQDKAGLGYRLGFDFSVPVSPRFEVISSIAYGTKGASIQSTQFLPEQGLVVGSYDYDYTVYQGQMMLGIKPVNGVRIQIGGFLDAMSNEIPISEQNIFIGDLTQEFEGRSVSTLSESFSGIDYGPVVGLSLGTEYFRVTAQYMHGLANLYNYSGPNASGHDINTQSFSVAATYFFLK